MATQVRKTRAQRTAAFQHNLRQLAEAGAEPAQILTRLFNGMTTELSLAEAEIERLQGELETLRTGVDLQVCGI
jgi:phage shock protein A